jgi:hypothetical protein
VKEPPPDPRPRLLAGARELASQRRWPWLEPVEISLSSSGTAGPLWTILTNSQARGMNVRIVIREADESIVQAGYLPR